MTIELSMDQLHSISAAVRSIDATQAKIRSLQARLEVLQRNNTATAAEGGIELDEKELPRLIIFWTQVLARKQGQLEDLYGIRIK